MLCDIYKGMNEISRSVIIKDYKMQDSIKDKYVYNPNKTYYFISVKSLSEGPKWIRRGYQTEDEVKEFIQQYADFTFVYKDLQIYDEKLLHEEVGIKSEGNYIETNLREWIFDGRYSAGSDFYRRIRSGEREMSWKEGYEEWKAGELSQSSSEI
jgi:hypothetical protein